MEEDENYCLVGRNDKYKRWSFALHLDSDTELDKTLGNLKWCLIHANNNKFIA